MTTTDHDSLAEQIAREHGALLNTSTWLIVGCTCDPTLTAPPSGAAGSWYAAHIATVTERAVRERVAGALASATGALTEYLDAWSCHDAAVWADTPAEAAEDILARLAAVIAIGAPDA